MLPYIIIMTRRGIGKFFGDAAKAVGTIAFYPETTFLKAVGGLPRHADPFGGEKVLGIGTKKPKHHKAKHHKAKPKHHNTKAHKSKPKAKKRR